MLHVAQIINEKTYETMATVEYSRVFFELFEGAIYLHQVTSAL